MSTLTFTDASVLDDLDFAPPCAADPCLTDRIATHLIRLKCGCVGLACLPCAERCLRIYSDSIAIIRARGHQPTWVCVMCGGRGFDHPIQAVVPL